MGTLGYTVKSLERFTQLGKTDVRGFAGFTEEMSHGFKSYYRCDGTYEALGVAVQEDITRRLVSSAVADKYWLPEHKQWEQTYKAWRAANNRNPDPTKYPWNVLYTRILNHLFYTLQAEYGPDMWRDFFIVLKQMDFPLHRAAKTDRMKVYADIAHPIKTECRRGIQARVIAAFEEELEKSKQPGYEPVETDIPEEDVSQIV